MAGRLLPCGEFAVLVELADLDAVLSLQAALAEASDQPGWESVVDVVPAAVTVLVGVDDPAALPGVRERLATLLRTLRVTPAGELGGDPIEVEVVYDGDDLAEVGRLVGLSADEVVDAHTGTHWTVAFGGFAPGFSYLVGGDPRLEVPRRAEPRTTVPAGAVGLAGRFSGIYPRPSPGGWQLIGRTDAVLFDVNRDPPALLQPGRRVRFVASRQTGSPVVEPVETPAGGLDELDQRNPGLDKLDQRDSGLNKLDQQGPGLTITGSGPLAIIVDEGRPGFAAMGVSRSGAADRGAYALANRLVGNTTAAPAIEITLGGLSVTADATFLVALTGADCAATIDGRPVTHNGPLYLREGQQLALGIPASGLRSYLAVAGGLAAALTLGSASTDTLSGLGPARLQTGDRIAVATPQAPRFADVDLAPFAPLAGASIELDLLPGPRSDWLADDAALTGTTWRVSSRSDRVGVRLEGDPLTRSDAHAGDELDSEPMVRGSVQVPPDGRPVIFCADHPVTGGYPVVGVLTGKANDRVAQARPGDAVVFRRLR